MEDRDQDEEKNITRTVWYQSKRRAKIFEPDPRFDSIELHCIEEYILKLLMFFQLLLTLISLGIAISSPFRDDSDLEMLRSSYWWYAMHSLFIFVTLWQTLSAVNKEDDNFDAYTCSFLLTTVCFLLEITTNFIFDIVAFPKNQKFRPNPWEYDVLVYTNFFRFLSFMISLIFMTGYVGGYTRVEFEAGH